MTFNQINLMSSEIFNLYIIYINLPKIIQFQV